MTLDDAIRIRTRQLQGEPVHALVLQRALAVIEANRPKRVGRPYKTRLPVIPAPERERLNAVLLYRLGIALGRIQERKAA